MTGERSKDQSDVPFSENFAQNFRQRNLVKLVDN